jgi:hypothetical protein
MTRPITTCAATCILPVLTVAFVLALAPVQVAAQGDVPDASGGVHLGPLSLNPSVGWNTGYDDNVFRSAARPLSDIISTIGARAGVRGQLRRVGLTASGAADWVHYAKLSSQRGANVGAGLKLDFLFNWIAPYVSISYGNSRQRLNPEIDTRPRIGHSTVAVGGVFRLGSGKTSLDFSARRAKETYDRNARVDGVSLGEALNRGTDDVALSLIREVTPLTRLNVTGEVFRDQFHVSSYRNANNVRVTAGFESDGRINGSARVGVRILKPHDPNQAEFRGLFVSLGTGATVLDRLQIGVNADRDVVPSYRPGVPYYALYGYGGSVTYAMFGSVRLSAQTNRRLGDYRALGGAASRADRASVDRETSYGSGISYLLGKSLSIDFSGTYTKRKSDLATRRFDNLSLTAGVSHAF